MLCWRAPSVLTFSAPHHTFPQPSHCPNPTPIVSCGTAITKSCECYRRCAEYACFTDWKGDKRCHGRELGCQPACLPAARPCGAGRLGVKTEHAAAACRGSAPAHSRKSAWGQHGRRLLRGAASDVACLCSPTGRCCVAAFAHVANRGCYTREGVSPDEQYSRIPEPEETDVKCYTSYGPGAREVHCRCAVRAVRSALHEQFAPAALGRCGA